MMRRFLAYAFCTACMIGVYFLLRFAVLGISSDFGDGFSIGMAIMAILFWGADRVQRNAR